MKYLYGVIFLLIACNQVTNKEKHYEIGTKIDSLNKVYVYYNGAVGTVKGRNVTKDGYNLGLKYQCVEFVKRYYYEHFHHKMPDSYGHAKDFYNYRIKDGALNKQRNLLQFKNPSFSKPKITDLVIFDGSIWNKYGHVAIISKVTEHNIEIIQQNVGKTTREIIDLEHKNNKWLVKNNRVLGWLRKK